MLANGGHPIGPAPLGWRVKAGLTCSRVTPHDEGDVQQNAEMNADHYFVDVTKPEMIKPDMVLMFQNESDDGRIFYPDGLVVVERLESGTSWSGRRVWVTRLGRDRMDPTKQWVRGYFAHVRELSPVSAEVLEALGGRI